ncbi:thioredoxin 1 [Pseudomonas flavescens]|uniref:Thioredoxin 1 n=1 Tax=Phytopseudomonas flavescens TaxID=29435 RepID=A0A1G8GNC4_9GAMM|nr:hypothetical protein [Pseudomonas flavescens]SDH95817.1 thioredoxin 1 [Pseudomonas flavescens]
MRDGQELARRTGVMSFAQMRDWLARHGVATPERAPESSAGEVDDRLGGAFYGDAELKAFLFERLLRHAAAGQIVESRFPYWFEGQGTVSAALVHSANIEVFQRLAGLPPSLGCALHFAGLSLEADIREVVGAIQPGTRLEHVAPTLLQDWLADEQTPWQALLQKPALDDLRQRWLQLARDGASTQQWHSLRQEALDAISKGDPYCATQDAFLQLLANASPIPDPDNGSAWVTALLLHGTLLVVRSLQVEQGWSTEDMAVESLRYAWFKQREEKEPDGRFSDERLAELRSQWERDNTSWLRLNQDFMERYPILRRPHNSRLRASLTAQLQSAPKASAA